MDMDVEGRSAGVNQSGSDKQVTINAHAYAVWDTARSFVGARTRLKLLSTQVSGARPSSHEGTSGSFNIAQPQAEVS
eukprot:CAMPEP_0181242388 /NCGR_PEP_ID=MMETSP1096-20121128/41658_1 /TAXON_ID=156174 ORGANISM="Chrysochromulina ericina, Strain CCMP281" /NCGR_SAMPLE_ID=MMETSP1096 /ASSEMBLY_ACC=CAM_ASM_000453 /LENGTH=76 /DNA_ID=CAMNT_0023338583 /DNA_START=391 /DNA_END=622 /DNA_ORIENTATION=-